MVKYNADQVDYQKVQLVIEGSLGPGPYKDREQLEECIGYHLEDLEEGDIEEILEFFAEDGIPF